jgi:putative ABC transport system permease protein
VTSQVTTLAATLHAESVVFLEQVHDPLNSIVPARSGPDRPQPAGYETVTLAKVIASRGGEEVTSPVTLYVATPEVLGHYGIRSSQVDPTTDILTGRSDLGGRQVFAPGSPVAAQPDRGAPLPDRRTGMAHPTMQHLSRLPAYTSDPSALITPHAMELLGLQPIPAGWLFQTAHPLTPTQIHTATTAAAAAGLLVETRTAQKSLAPLRNWATAVGSLVALGVLGMTVGLIRSETADDLRTLTATGATTTTRRTITGATSGALALLGAVLGTAGAYAALLAWHRSNLGPLGRVPVVDLVAILAGLPVVATTAGWLLAGRQPPAIARAPLE